MKLHEYQAKDIFRKSGIPVPNSQLVTDSDQAFKAVKILNGPPWVIKAQVHAGGRGKAGGIKFAHYPYEVVTATETLFGMPLVTKQTGPEGVTVHQVLIEQGMEIEREFYLSMVVDRVTAMPTMIFSKAGGMAIEEVADETPELIMKEEVDPALGWMPHQAKNLVYNLDPLPQPATVRALMSVMSTVYNLFTTLDCSLLEINPLAETREGKVFAKNMGNGGMIRVRVYF